MNKKILVVLALTVFSMMFFNEKTYAVVQTPNERGYVTVTTSANAELLPNVVDISFAVKTNDSKSMQKAALGNKEISEQLYNVLSGMLDATKGDYLKTADYNAYPIYNYSGNKKSFDKYEVSNKVIIHTKNIDKVGEIIDNAINAGATNVDNLTFSISKYDEECDALIGVATKKAQQRANVIAKNLMTSVTGVKSFSASCSANNNNVTRMYMNKNMAYGGTMQDGAPESSTSISKGIIKIYANVNANFFIK